ncbi:T9SS type A sorting domain-containing protein, partial [Parabacteroides sp. OttesenSCG-928-J18]|nr:T9SS type A sorting domain-containing protein [Parabacteroides sp. OttesenSCG-928-J18]
QWISNGKLTYLNYVTDFHTTTNRKSYYDTVNGYTDDRFMPTVEAALNQEKTVKLSELTSLEGRLLAINIFYAGTPDAGWANGLWPHMGWYNFHLKGFHEDAWHTFQMTNLGNSLSIGTFIHENGHLVCNWPDFYSYDGHDDNNDKYNMGAGNDRNPGYPSPWCLDQMGWLNKIDLTTMTDETLITLHHRVGEAALYDGSANNNAAPNEKYYLEVRRGTPTHPEPFDGIFIWHINELGDNTTAGKPELQDCRPANLTDPCFKKGNATRFNDDTFPSAIWYNGQRSGINIWDVSAAGATMTFSYTPPITVGIERVGGEEAIFYRDSSGSFGVVNQDNEVESIAVYDVSGRLIEKIRPVSDNHLFGTGYSSGIYLINIRTKTGQQTFKAVK